MNTPSSTAQKLVVAIASDHAGFELKRYIMTQFDAVPVTWIDLGPHSADSVDYPDYGYRLAESIETKEVQFGVAICGSGVGISIAVNRNLAVRCALCTTPDVAWLSREHNDANVIALGARLLTPEAALNLLQIFLTTPFEGGERHERRVKKLSTCSP